jgi:hypothetical protein
MTRIIDLKSRMPDLQFSRDRIFDMFDFLYDGNDAEALATKFGLDDETARDVIKARHLSGIRQGEFMSDALADWWYSRPDGEDDDQ